MTNKLADPKILMAIKDLQLAAKTTIDGFMTGINKSTIKGPGLEFSQYRSYQPGDDLRWLDWKMYGRSDRYYIRESEVETSISIRFVIDASASMNHEDSFTTKIQYAKYLAASLGWLAGRQGDAIGLYVLNESGLFSLDSRRDSQHMARFFFQLENIRATGKFVQQVSYRDIFSATRKRELLVVISDLFEEKEEIFELLDTLAAQRHEILVFHLMGGNEMKFDYGGFAALQDLETGQVVRIDPSTQTKAYQEQIATYLAGIRSKLLNKHIFYRMMQTDQPLDQALRDFLNQRNKTAI